MRTKAMQKEEVLSVKPSSVKKAVEEMSFDEFRSRMNCLFDARLHQNNEGKMFNLHKDYHIDIWSANFSMKFNSRVNNSSLSYIIDYGHDNLTIWTDSAMFSFESGETISIYELTWIDGKVERIYAEI